MRVLVVNSGSSSLKLRVIDDGNVMAAEADLPPVDSAGDDTIRAAIADLGSFDAVGHRVVHGGRSYTEPTIIDAHVRRELEGLAPLAPLHQPPAFGPSTS